jgi:hypothetical protein
LTYSLIQTFRLADCGQWRVVVSYAADGDWE